MISSQRPDATLGARVDEHEASLRWTHEQDMALGCECADPVLQIEQWSLEQGKGQVQAQPQPGRYALLSRKS